MLIDNEVNNKDFISFYSYIKCHQYQSKFSYRELIVMINLSRYLCSSELHLINKTIPDTFIIICM
jgi:hypothetical protein